MSAFVVSKEHIDALVSVALRGPAGGTVSPDTAWHSFTYYAGEGDTIEEWQELRRDVRHDTTDETGRRLWAFNAAAVRHRYPDLYEDESTYPGPIGFTPDDPFSYTYTPPKRRPTAVEALKLIRCYAYQTCEHRLWKGSEAERFCDALTDALVSVLPGYAEAPWEWTDTKVSA